MDIVQHPKYKHALNFAGSPLELADMVDELNASETGVIEFGGLLAASTVNRSAKHDGNPAYSIELSDAHGSRSVGRLVLMDTDQQLDNQPEWTVYYDDEETAQENLLILGARNAAPKIISHQVDWTYENETLEESLAELSARFGVSTLVLVENGPGGGWPIIQVTGKYENVERWLKSEDDYGYGMDEDDMKEFFYNI